MLEDDYGMIDGIINKGDRRKEDEKKDSVMDRKKKEATVAENNAPKPKESVRKQETELSQHNPSSGCQCRLVLMSRAGVFLFTDLTSIGYEKERLSPIFVRVL